MQANKANMSLGKFRAEVSEYNSFQLMFDAPLSPFSFSTLFDQIAVILSASSYVALKNSNGYFCLSHIRTIKKCDKENGRQPYIFVCDDFTSSNDPAPITVTLNCA